MTDSNKKTAFQILIGYRKCCFYDKICCNDLTIHVIVKIQNNLRRKKVKMIQNPILPGFNPDPCICRKGDDYYLAVSTFEWFPGIPVYHSRDLKNWELYTHVLTDDEKVDLKKLPSAKGIWAPCLTYCEEEDMFYVVYGVMNSMNARYFDVDNFMICAKDIRGPWSEPVYLHSSGFDASMFHDTN